MTYIKSRKVTLPLLTLTAGLLTAGVISNLTPSAPPIIEKVEHPWVDAISVSAEDFTMIVNTQGITTPKREIDLVAKVSGTMHKVSTSFADGGFFLKNDTLALLDDRDYQYALIRAEARYAEARQQLVMELARSKLAREEWKELRNDEANELALRKPQLNQAKAILRAANADREQALYDIERSVFKAPFDGRVKSQYVDEGQYVTPGTKIATILSTDTIEIRLPLNDNQLGLLDLPTEYHHPDSPYPEVLIHGTIGGKEYYWDGLIKRTEATINPENRVTYAIAEVENPSLTELNKNNPSLSIGLFVGAAIVGREFSNVFALPISALRNGHQVFTITNDSRLKINNVVVLKMEPKRVIVNANWPKDSLVVLSTVNTAIDGMLVNYKESLRVASH